MDSNLKHRNLPEPAATSHDAAQLLARARELDSLHSGMAPRMLRGKNIGLLCDADDNVDAALFQRAASALGAQVARLRPNLTATSTPQEVQHTARILGRLYDAVECVGMAPELVDRIGAEAGVPVFDGIASPQHPTAALANQLPDGASLENRRCLVIQAVLLNALA